MGRYIQDRTPPSSPPSQVLSHCFLEEIAYGTACATGEGCEIPIIFVIDLDRNRLHNKILPYSPNGAQMFFT